MLSEIETPFSRSMERAAKRIYTDLKQQYPQFSANIVLREDKLKNLKKNFKMNTTKMRKDMRYNGRNVVLDRHKLSSCAVKTIIETNVFEFDKTGIGEREFPATLAYANEYFAYTFVPTIVDAFRVKIAQSKSIPVYTFPIIYGSNPKVLGEASVENFYYFDYIFCKIINTYKACPSTFPVYDFAVLLCSLNTAWNCYISTEAGVFYYEQ